MIGRDLVAIADLTPESILELLDSAELLKKNGPDQSLSGKVLTTIFEKPSLRTKASLEIGAQLLGGHVVAFGAHEGEWNDVSAPMRSTLSRSRLFRRFHL